MNSDFVKKGIVLPLITALVAGIAAFILTGNNLVSVIPFSNKSEVLYFDSEASGEAVKNLSELKAGDLIGEVKSEDKLPLRYEAPYSSLISECSLSEKGAGLNETGATFIKIINSNADKFSDEIVVSGKFGEMKLKKTDEKTLASEGEVFLVTPRAEKSIIVYYQLKGEHGLSSEYKAIVYGEAV